MATIVFEDKLSECLGLVEKASHGYYISNGVYHQNLEKVDVNAFIKAVKTTKKMLEVAFENQSRLMQQHDKSFAHEAFWNNLKRQQKRFDAVGKSQLDTVSNKNNVSEISEEVYKKNQQVISQLKNAVEYNLTQLPVLFFTALNQEDKVRFYEDLQSNLLDLYHQNNPSFELIEADFTQEIPDENEILSWFITKDELVAQEKSNAEKEFENNQKEIEEEKQKALADANKQAELAMAEAKKRQEEALKMMAELQKKHGLV